MVSGSGERGRAGWAGAVGECPHRPRRPPVPARSASTPETWARFTQENLYRAERERLASVNLRVLIDCILRDTAEDLRLQCDAVNLAFGRRCEELEDACHKLKNHLHKVKPRPRAPAPPPSARAPPPRPGHIHPRWSRAGPAPACPGPAPAPRPGPAPPRPRPVPCPGQSLELSICNYRATKLLVAQPRPWLGHTLAWSRPLLCPVHPEGPQAQGRHSSLGPH